METTDLVVLKTALKATKNQTDYRANVFYRCCVEPNGYLIHGEFFTKKEFDSLFEYVYDRVMRDFKELGMLGADNKPISRNKFNKLASVHTYGRGRKALKIYYFYKDTHVKIYGFYPSQGTKAENLQECYQWYLDIVSGNVEPLDGRFNRDVVFGNSGIPLAYGDLRLS